MARAIIYAALILLLACCSDKEEQQASSIVDRDRLPVLKSIGISTLISDSGIIRYKIIAEDWLVYDKTDTTYWLFDKGLFIEKFDDDYHVDAFINCDTAYYYDKLQLWELRSRVFVKNLRGETFRTSLLYWDQLRHTIYSHAYMEIDGENELRGYDFYSDESMTEYLLHSAAGATNIKEQPIDTTRAEMQDEDMSP